MGSWFEVVMVDSVHPEQRVGRMAHARLQQRLLSAGDPRAVQAAGYLAARQRAAHQPVAHGFGVASRILRIQTSSLSQ